ncbi:MAG: hypothetical protein HRU15_07335, partial [Planctomycetes bacterium]|nr:hypothetical protein [Planctomycetota bacterium]
MPTPFDRIFQQVTETAQQDPREAFAQLELLYNKSATEEDVLKICALAANLGGAALGLIDETIEFLTQLLSHPAINFVNNEVRRSVWRAISVMHLCVDDVENANAAKEQGVTNASENCRLSTMAANTLIARQRMPQAIPHLKLAAALCQEISADDEVIQQVATIGSNISRMAESQLHIAKELLLHSTYACKQAWLTSDDWHVQHKARYNYAKALMNAGQPTKGLDEVGKMMKLENSNKAGPLERFFSAAVACRGQCMRGQVKIATQAITACETFAGKVDTEKQEIVNRVLEEITGILKKERDRANT